MAHQNLGYIQPSTPPIGVRTPGETRARAHARGKRVRHVQFILSLPIRSESPPRLAYITYTFDHLYPYPSIELYLSGFGKGPAVNLR